MRLAALLGERVYVPNLLVQQGRIAAGTGKRDLARHSMAESLRLAREQGALWLGLSALAALCELDAGSAEHIADLRAAFELAGRSRTPLAGRVRERLGLESVPTNPCVAET
jgi:hypothetical protein